MLLGACRFSIFFLAIVAAGDYRQLHIGKVLHQFLCVNPICRIIACVVVHIHDDAVRPLEIFLGSIVSFELSARMVMPYHRSQSYRGVNL